MLKGKGERKRSEKKETLVFNSEAVSIFHFVRRSLTLSILSTTSAMKLYKAFYKILNVSSCV